MNNAPFVSVLTLIDNQINKRPESPALAAADCSLTFAQLGAQVEKLACRLRQAGIGTESRVAIHSSRSSRLPVAVLAVLKCGACYVPLDPGHPPHHMRRVLDEARPDLILADGELALELAAAAPVVLRLDTHADNTVPAFGADWSVLPDAAAYLMYTSGSTGEPLGVAITHRGLAGYVMAMAKALGLESGSSYLHTASFGFSSSVRQLLLPLAVGMRVVLTEGPVADASELAALLDGHPLAVLDMTPSLYGSVLPSEGQWLESPLADVRLGVMLSASEMLPPALGRSMKGADTGVRVFNMYGQTETTGIVATFALPEVPGDGVVPVGRPIAGVRAYVLDGAGGMADVGVPGELFVGGATLARGYLGQADRTAERFVPSPFGNGERLYRTGDRARWRSDGMLEILGRVDHQVKLRGARIELGQVEAALARKDGVARAAAAVHGAGADALLVGYVVPAAGVALDGDALRASLHHALPEYMVPHSVQVLAALPLNHNGKLDRQALPAPSFQAPEADDETAPGLETELAQVWAAVLKVGKVGPHASFFDLGGHSLLAMTLIARVNRAFDVKLKLMSLMNSPTVSKMAQQIELARQAAAQGLV
ncbi:MAG: hypothetical protein NVSMB6_01330 [Burkholderiaceae bacterium]